MNIQTTFFRLSTFFILFGSWFVPALQAATPATPSHLVLTPGNNQVTISWHDNASNENGYKIFRDGALIALVPANSTTYRDTGLMGNHTYNYTVKATEDSTKQNEMLLDEEEENNGACEGELLQALNGIYQEVDYSGHGIMHASYDMDHYNFKPAVAGTLAISVTSTNDSLGFIAGSSCGDDDYGRSENSANHTRSFHIAPRQYIALRVHDWNATNEAYTMNITFTPDENSTRPPDDGTSSGHAYKNNLTDGAGGKISLPELVNNDASVGTVKGTLSISQGKANYHLPIPVPPGRAGMEPKLSLDYSSQEEMVILEKVGVLEDFQL